MQMLAFIRAPELEASHACNEQAYDTPQVAVYKKDFIYSLSSTVTQHNTHHVLKPQRTKFKSRKLAVLQFPEHKGPLATWSFKETGFRMCIAAIFVCIYIRQSVKG